MTLNCPMVHFQRDGRAPIPESETTSRVMSANRGKNTGPELLLRKFLRDVGEPGYRIHWEKAPGRPDIAYPGKRVAIFVNGCFWHRCPHCNPSTPKTHREFWQEKFTHNVERDRERKESLEKDGWTVLMFWECQIRKDPRCVALKIKERLDE
jgi:DNA mismatch endonuclease, patch repair protein